MRISVFVIILFGLLSLSGQAVSSTAKPYRVKGIVKDSLTNEAVSFATISVLSVDMPPKVIASSAADDKGAFSIYLASPGAYQLSIQYVGLATKAHPFTVSESTKTKDFGEITMSSNQELAEVVVTAQKPLVKVDIDKITYSVADDPEAHTSTALDMLRKVPMITVDGEDNIQLKGSSSYKIYLNGKPSNMLANSPSDVLKSMPANTVKDVEVITDPGAKYDAEGVGGIINIITEKNSALEGFTGTVRANASTFGSFGGGAYLSAKIGKLGLTGNINYNNRNSPWGSSVIEQTIGDEITKQNGRNKNKGPFLFGYLEASFEIDTFNLISLGVNNFTGKSKNYYEMDAMTYRNVVTADSLVEHYLRNNRGESEFGSTDISLDYQHSTMKKDELLTLSYRFSRSPNNSESYNEIIPILDYFSRKQMDDNDASTREHTGQIDYTTPTWGKQTLEAGLKYIYRDNRSVADRMLYNDSLNTWKPAPVEVRDHFEHMQHIYSAYVGYAFRFDKMSVKGGLRAEGTSLDVKYKLAPDANFDKNYFDLVPSFSAAYMLSMGQQFRLGYNMRIQRPGIWYLNPYVNDVDPKNISYGNTKLETEKGHNVSLSYNYYNPKITVNVSANYSFMNNAIESYSFKDADDVMNTTYGNIAKKHQTGMYFYGNWTPTTFFRLFANGGFNYLTTKSKQLGISQDGVSGNLFAGMQFTLPKDFRINVNGGGFYPARTLQMKMDPMFMYGLSLTKDFLKKKLTVGVSSQMPFQKDMKHKMTTTGKGFAQVSEHYRRTGDFRFSVSYRFGSMKAQIKKVRRGITNDDVKAGASGEGGGSGSSE